MAEKKTDTGRRICVQGTGTLKLRPDTTRVMLTLQGEDMDYGTAVAASASRTDLLKAALEKAGFARTDVKTVSFRVDPKYEGYQVGNEWRQRFAGYQFHHQLKLEFPVDGHRLGQVLAAAVNTDTSPEISVFYTVKDREEAKKSLLEKAVRDARGKAEILAAAAGTAVGRTVDIRYGVAEPVFEARPMMMKAMRANGVAEDCAVDIGAEPDDIEVNEQVTITWELTDPS